MVGIPTGLSVNMHFQFEKMSEQPNIVEVKRVAGDIACGVPAGGYNPVQSSKFFVALIAESFVVESAVFV